jgi:hypothetical protein
VRISILAGAAVYTLPKTRIPNVTWSCGAGHHARAAFLIRFGGPDDPPHRIRGVRVPSTSGEELGGEVDAADEPGSFAYGNLNCLDSGAAM